MKTSKKLLVQVYGSAKRLDNLIYGLAVRGGVKKPGMEGKGLGIGSEVGTGKVGKAGVGTSTDGILGNIGELGKVGSDGTGKFGKLGTNGTVKRPRAAEALSMPENDKAMRNAKRNNLEIAILLESVIKERKLAILWLVYA